MNFLELVQETNSEAGFQGSITSVSATGYQERIVYAVKKAWIDIQKKRSDWNFMRTSTTFNTASGTNVYDVSTIGITDHSEWIKKSLIYDYAPLTEYDYDLYLTTDISSQSGEPTNFSIRPSDHALIIWPSTGTYSIEAHYWKTPQVLTDTIDTPGFKVEHHRLIVNAAVLRMTAFINNPSIYTKHSDEFRDGLGELMRKEVPTRRIKARPLV